VKCRPNKAAQHDTRHCDHCSHQINFSIVNIKPSTSLAVSHTLAKLHVSSEKIVSHSSKQHFYFQCRQCHNADKIQLRGLRPTTSCQPGTADKIQLRGLRPTTSCQPGTADKIQLRGLRPTTSCQPGTADKIQLRGLRPTTSCQPGTAEV